MFTEGRTWNQRRQLVLARLVALPCICGLALWGSVSAGTPPDLPEIAMQWPLLFHVERATVLLAAVGLDE